MPMKNILAYFIQVSKIEINSMRYDAGSIEISNAHEISSCFFLNWQRNNMSVWSWETNMSYTKLTLQILLK